MLLTDSFAAAQKQDIFIFISAPAIEGAPFLAVINKAESLFDVSALTREELVLAVRDKLGISTEQVAELLLELFTWQPVVGKDWHQEKSSGYFVRISPFLQPGQKPEDSEVCFLIWHSFDNGSMHLSASRLRDVPDVDPRKLYETAALAIEDSERLRDLIVGWWGTE